MTRDDIIDWVTEVDMEFLRRKDEYNGFDKYERFAEIVAAHEREKYGRIKDHLSDAEEIIQRMMRERESAVLAEREACAKVCDEVLTHKVLGAPEDYKCGRDMGATVCAAAIRARGEK